MLRTRHDVVEVAQADLEFVALHAHGLLLLALDRKIDLDDRDRLVGLADLILRVLGEVPAHLRKPLLCPLFLAHEPIHALDRLRNAVPQLGQAIARIVHLAARILVDIEDLRLVVLDRVNRIRQQPAQLPLLDALCGALIHPAVKPPSLISAHRTLLNCICVHCTPFPCKSHVDFSLAFSRKNR